MNFNSMKKSTRLAGIEDIVRDIVLDNIVKNELNNIAAYAIEVDSASASSFKSRANELVCFVAEFKLNEDDNSPSSPLRSHVPAPFKCAIRRLGRAPAIASHSDDREDFESCVADRDGKPQLCHANR